MTYALDEVRLAAAALEAGEFRTGLPGQRRTRSTTSAAWHPDEPVLVVAGAVPRVGSTVTAMAIAEAADDDVRLVEVGPMRTTGLAEATTAELGITENSWRRGSRGAVLVERATSSFERPEDVPAPEPTERALTVLDLGWDMTRVLASDSWLAAALTSHPLVLTTVATVPGLRALGAAIQLCDRRGREVHVVVLGPPHRKWPKDVARAVTSDVSELAELGRLHALPHDRHLAVSGIGSDALPPAVLRAATSLLECITTTKGSTHVR